MGKRKETEHEELLRVMAEGFGGVHKRIDNVEVDISSIKRDVAFLRSTYINSDEFQNLEKRVSFLERRVGTKNER